MPLKAPGFTVIAAPERPVERSVTPLSFACAQRGTQLRHQPAK
jgi:hypothetical protein